MASLAYDHSALRDALPNDENNENDGPNRGYDGNVMINCTPSTLHPIAPTPHHPTSPPPQQPPLPRPLNHPTTTSTRQPINVPTRHVTRSHTRVPAYPRTRVPAYPLNYSTTTHAHFPGTTIMWTSLSRWCVWCNRSRRRRMQCRRARYELLVIWCRCARVCALVGRRQAGPQRAHAGARGTC